MLLSSRLHGDVPDRRPDRPDAGVAAARLPPHRLLLRRRPFPLCALRRLGASASLPPATTGSRSSPAGCLDERLGRVHFMLMFVGFHMTFFVQHLLGLEGMPRRIATTRPPRRGAPEHGVHDRRFIMGTLVLPFLYNVWWSRRGPSGRPDPWGGHTLEWWTSRRRRPRTSRAAAIRSERPVFDFRWMNHPDVSAIGTTEAWKDRQDHDARWIPLHPWSPEDEPRARPGPTPRRAPPPPRWSSTRTSPTHEDRADHLVVGCRLLRRARRDLLGGRRGCRRSVAVADGNVPGWARRRMDLGLAPAQPSGHPAALRSRRRRRRRRGRHRRGVPDRQPAPAGPRVRHHGRGPGGRARVVDADRRHRDHRSQIALLTRDADR